MEAVGREVRSVKPGDHVVIATLQSCGTCRACSTGHPTWCVKTLGNVSQPFTYQRRAGVQLRRHLGLRRVHHREGGAGGQDLQGRPDDLGLPHRMRGPHRCRVGAQPGQGAGRGDRRGVRRGRCRPQRHPGPAHRRRQPDHRRGHPGGEGGRWPASSGPPTSSTPRRPTPWPPSARSCPPGPDRVSGALGWTGGVNWSFDCVGHPAVLRNALDVLDWGGNALAIGIPPQGTEVSVDVNALAYVDRGLLGCRYGSSRPHHDIPLMVELYLSGQLMLDELVTEERPLEGFREIVEDMEAGQVGPRRPHLLTPGRLLARRRDRLGPVRARGRDGDVLLQSAPDMTARQIEGEFDTVGDVLRAAAQVNADVEAYVEPASRPSPPAAHDLRRVGPGRRRRGRAARTAAAWGGARWSACCCRAPSTTWSATPPPPDWARSPRGSTSVSGYPRSRSILERTLRR